jgi:hypothetical protein
MHYKFKAPLLTNPIFQNEELTSKEKEEILPKTKGGVIPTKKNESTSSPTKKSQLVVNQKFKCHL